MTSENGNQSTLDLDQALPDEVTVSGAFTRRLPSQRLIDTLAKIESMQFSDLATNQPFRIIAFRALLRDYPNRDVTSLWLAAYDVEVNVEEENPTEDKSLMLSSTLPPIGA
jgi:hypothetical protein